MVVWTLVNYIPVLFSSC